MELTHFSLFSGIGGFDLAAEWAGFRTIGLVEKNPYRQGVLRKYWSDMPLWEDIKDVTKETLERFMADAGFITRWTEYQSMGEWKTRFEIGGCNSVGIGEQAGSIESFHPVTLITGGFPCQGFSIAGKRRGKADDRYLWPEMLRVIRLIRPHWVVGENVDGIIRVALDTVLSDLESEGYSAKAFVIPACGVNAPHRRYRVWIVAHYEGSGLGQELNKFTSELLPENRPPQELEGDSGYVPDPEFAEVGNGAIIGGASDEGGGVAQAGGEAVRSGEEAPQPGDPGQGGEALAHAIDNRGGASGCTDDRDRQEDNEGGEGWSEPGSSGCGEDRGGRGSSRNLRSVRNGVHRAGHRLPGVQYDSRWHGDLHPEEDVAAPHIKGLEDKEGGEDNAQTSRFGTPSLPGWWELEPDVGRVADGVPHRVDRLAALGDAVVPQVPYQILKYIAEIEKMLEAN